jgi:hypothetical protein
VPEEEIFLFLPDDLFREAGAFLFALTLPEDLEELDDEPDPWLFIIYKKIWESGRIIEYQPWEIDSFPHVAKKTFYFNVGM